MIRHEQDFSTTSKTKSVFMNFLKRLFSKASNAKTEAVSGQNSVSSFVEKIELVKEPVSEKDTKTKDFLKSVTSIKNEHGFQVAVQAMITFLESNKLSLDDQVRVIKKMFPYVENKKSGFDKKWKDNFYNKYVLSYLQNKPITAVNKVDLLTKYNSYLKTLAQTPDEIYQKSLSYFTDRTSLNYFETVTDIGRMLEEINSGLRLKFYKDNFENMVEVMNSIPHVNRYKIQIYNDYTSDLIDNNELDQAFVMCRRTEHDILYKSPINKEYHPDDFYNENDEFINVYNNKATISYKQNAFDDCIYFFLHCVLIQYMSQNYSHYSHLQRQKAQFKRYGKGFEYNEQEYYEQINSYKIKDVFSWYEEYNDSPPILTDILKETKTDIQKVIAGLQDYAEKKLFKIYHSKLLWLADMSDSINKIVSSSKVNQGS